MVGARNTQTFLLGFLIRCPSSYISSTAMWVFPHPVPRYTMMFSSTAFLHSSIWYLEIKRGKKFINPLKKKNPKKSIRPEEENTNPQKNPKRSENR